MEKSGWQEHKWLSDAAERKGRLMWALTANVGSCIQTDSVVTFIRDVYNIAPTNFWVQPSSTSGNWHPADEFVEGGKALHTLKSIRLACEMCRAFPEWVKVDHIDFSSRRTVPCTDLFLAAVALHDVCANGLDDDVYMKDGKVATHPEHPLLVRSLIPTYCLDHPWWVRDLLDLIEGHSGIWSPEGYSPFDVRKETGVMPLEFLREMVHWVDYVVSRNFVQIEELKP